MSKFHNVALFLAAVFAGAACAALASPAAPALVDDADHVVHDKLELLRDAKGAGAETDAGADR